MKQRFSSLDVKIIAHELSNSLTSLRLANVYDLSSRIFLLKFQKPDQREQLVVDSGFRCHLSKFARATAAAPSPFVARLRKFLRTRRCTGVRQIGTDRVIELTFSHADGVYRLFLEFYAGGNVILTDNDFTILGLLRSVSEGAEHEQYRAGLKYNLSLRQNADGVPDLTKEWLKEALQKTATKQAEQPNKPGKKIKKKTGDTLRKALAVTTTQFPPILLDHAIHISQVDRELEPQQVVDSDDLLEKVLQALQLAESVVQDITSQPVAKGYILAQRKSPAQQKEGDDNADDTKGLMYEDFHPFKPIQLAEDSSNVFLEHDGFNIAVDEFFSSIEGQKLESKLAEKEENAKKRIEYAKKEQEQRINGLQQVQELHVRKAQAIEANVERVEEAAAAVNGLIAQGMDWEDIGRLIEQEQKRHNAVAELIKLPLKLHENTMTLMLSELGVEDEDDDANETDSEPSDSEDEESKPAPAKHEDKRLTIDIDLAESAWVNARQYYDQKRSAAVKQEKTVMASKKAIKSTEQKVQAQLKKDLKQEKDVLRPVRKQFWFEKFIYFISSDGYLVLAGKDAPQNEILYRRHLKKGDVYIHADLQGAASVIVKNKLTPEDPIPPSTLAQAGDLAVCTSSAWDSKAVMSAWWVNADQVSKTAPTGEYLAAGGFVIKGKKNFLPPAKLLLGFGVMFQISEESKARHLKHRLELPRQNSYMATPDLTEADTAADSSVAGGSASDDDDFPDAAGPAPKIEGDGDDDEFPDVSHQADDVSSDECPNEQRRRTYGDNEDAEDDDEDHTPRSHAQNPLRSAGFTSSAGRTGNNDTDDEDEDDSGSEHLDDDAEDTGEPTAPEAEASTTIEAPASGDIAEADGEEAQSEDHAGPPQLSNKERKELARIQKGKPAQPALPSQKPTRGQRGKKKKMATKYANQDEEDRALAMQLLGSKAADERRAAEAAVKAEKKETEEEARARRKAQHERAQQKGLEAEEMRKLALDESVEDDAGAEAETAGLLDSLIGQPLVGDELLEAIPTVAPWAALAKYKYKVKLQPGQQKKGKATREILNKWLRDASDEKKLDRSSKDTERIWPREAELVKGWREPEVIGVIPVKSVRVMMSNATGDKGKGGPARGGKGGRGGKGSKKR
ncbi:Putative NFACT protein [Septoria linicola]|uniref:Ribosome quality control complex subunit 2 n=1 Tax=Septoria linicola TaxID=215465 RepID=A0A9Q9B2E2_9PEZI|nr:putative NFACT protein [Septoria linicola]USW56308.1 Putative NFACT protein [Septoria linicola]